MLGSMMSQAFFYLAIKAIKALMLSLLIGFLF